MKETLASLALFSVALVSCNYPDEKFETTSVLVVYPNPAIDFAYVRIDDPNYQELKAYDPKGDLATIEAFDAKSFRIDLRGRPKGTYHVIFKTSEKVFKSTFIKK